MLVSWGGGVFRLPKSQRNGHLFDPLTLAGNLSIHCTWCQELKKERNMFVEVPSTASRQGQGGEEPLWKPMKIMKGLLHIIPNPPFRGFCW